MRRTGAWGLVALLVAGSAWAQDPHARPGGHGADLQTGAVLVQVPALVTGASAEVAGALTAADFALRDNGVAQTVQLDEDAARPLSLVVLMQTGGAARLMFPQYRGLETMLAAVLGKAAYRVSIVSFDSRVEGATPFTGNIREWADAINEPEDGDHGAAIFDGLRYALVQLAAEPPGNRRAILLISQPQDDGSRSSAKAIVKAAGEANVAIYSLTFSPELASFKAQLNAPPHLNPPIVVNPSLPPTQAYFALGEPLRLLLGGMRKDVTAPLAEMSGGESMRFAGTKDLSAELNVLANHVANRYLLTFTPSSKQAGLHMLDVGVPGRPELAVRARRTYWMP